VLIHKGEPVRNARTMTVIMSTASLEHAVYPLDKALVGAVLGMEMNVVFEGAAVRLLKRGYRPRSSGLAEGAFTAIVERVMKKEDSFNPATSPGQCRCPGYWCSAGARPRSWSSHWHSAGSQAPPRLHAGRAVRPAAPSARGTGPDYSRLQRGGRTRGQRYYPVDVRAYEGVYPQADMGVAGGRGLARAAGLVTSRGRSG